MVFLVKKVNFLYKPAFFSIMRILILTMFKEGLGGGAGRVPFDMARAFSRKNDVALICPGDRTGILSREGRLTIFSIKANIRGNLSAVKWSKKTLSRFNSFIKNFNPDVIHANDFIDIDIYGMLYAIEHDIPFFYTGHVLPSKCLEFSMPNILAPASRWLERTTLKRYLTEFFRHCDGIVALNRHSYMDHARFCDREKVYIIPNGKDIKRYEKIPIARLKGRKTLLFIGFLSDRKNQAFLVEAMRYLPREYKLVLIGSELHLGYLRKLKRMCSEYGLENVEFTGEVEYKKIPSCIATSHLFVSASLMEVQSLVVLEAMASGRPVVGLKNETISELIDGKNGIALSRNTSPRRFADAVRKVLEQNEYSYRRMCIMARESVQNFDWDIVEKKLKKMYAEGARNYRHEEAGELMEFYKKVNLSFSAIVNSVLSLEKSARVQIAHAKRNRYLLRIRKAISQKYR